MRFSVVVAIGGLVQKGLHPPIPAFRDAARVVDLSRLMAPWNQAQIGSNISGSADARRIVDRSHKGERGQLADAWDGRQSAASCRGPCHAPYVGVDRGDRTLLLTQLYASICQPFEILSAYCKGYDQANPAHSLSGDLKEASWYEFARIVRNALSHDFHFRFAAYDRRKLPITWNSITISEDMDGEAMTHKTLWHKTGYELFMEMKMFADALPDGTR